MPKYRLLTRIGETRNEIRWDYYNAEKYVAPPPTLLNNTNSELNNKLQSLFSNNSVSYIGSFKKSDTPPDTTTVRIDNDESGTPIYAWTSSNEQYYDILYYTEAKSIIIDNGNGLFRNYISCNTIDVDIFDTSNVTDMQNMFHSCGGLTTLDVSNFNTSKVTDMRNMFEYCNQLATLDLSNFDTTNVENMSYMFSNCSSLTTLDVSNFNTSKVTDMRNMFEYCNQLATLDLSNFDTTNVENMSYMFSNCSSLTTLDVSNFNTSKVTYMSNMFRSCTSLTTIICTEEVEQWIRNNASTMKLTNIDNITFNRP